MMDDVAIQELYRLFPMLQGTQGMIDASTHAQGAQMSQMQQGAEANQNAAFEPFKHGNPAIGQTWNPWLDTLQGSKIKAGPSPEGSNQFRGFSTMPVDGLKNYTKAKEKKNAPEL